MQNQLLAPKLRINHTADSGAGSLRQAVTDANGTPAADVIAFNIPAGSCPGGVCTITLTSGEVAVVSTGGALTINGTGANQLTISADGSKRIFYSNAAIFTLSGITLTNGGGTGVFSGRGGAIYADGGTTIISGVYFNANNVASGGGIYFNGGTNHRVENSTFSANTATNNGGGIFVNTASLTVVNTTLTGNSAPVGGGIATTDNGTLTLRGDTITANTATNQYGGIFHDFGTIDVGNTIIAGNTATNGFPELTDGSRVTSQGFNLVGDSPGDSTDTGNNKITYQSTDIRDTPPLLDPTLKLNGGTTPNRALLFGSPALDKGNSFTLTTDQRGLNRPVNLPDATYPNAAGGDGADIGAYEAQTAPAAPTAATVSISGRVLTSAGRGITNVLLTLTDSQGNVKTTVSAKSGYYRFDDVEAGSTYIITATGKRFSFSQPTQVLNINDETTEVNFIADSEKRIRVF